MAETVDTESEEGSKSPDQLELFRGELKKRDEAADERQAQLIGELRAMRTDLSKPTERQTSRAFTAEELQGWLDGGQITQAQMIDYLAHQRAEEQIRKAEERLANSSRSQRERERVQAEVAKYEEAIPELGDKGSAEYKEAADAFKALVAEGADPKDDGTELAALRAAFGLNPGRKRGSKPTETTGERQKSVEGSSGNRDRRAPAERAGSDGLPSWVPEVNRRFYKDAIANRIYKGPKDPNLLKELEYLKKKVDAA